MKINYLKINGFGNLENKEVYFKDGINVLYGKNETGKSTLLKFIVGMFYGLSKNKNGKDISDFEKYKPWYASEFSGKLQYEINNNNTYEIFREFQKKNPKIFDENLNDISKNFNIDKNKGNEFFYEQTNINEDLFVNTAVVSQQETKLDKSNQHILTQNLSNLISTGSDNISYNKCIDKLNKKLTEEVGTERTTERPINIINNKIDNLENEINNLQNYKNKNFLISDEINNLIDKIKNIEININLLKKIKNIKEHESLEYEKIKINKNNVEQLNLKLDDLNNKLISISKKSKNKINKLNIIFLIIFIVLNIFIFFNNFNNIFNFAIIGSTIIYLLINLIYYFKNKKNNKLINNKKSDLQKEINLINENINNVKNDINDLEKNLSDSINLEKNNLINEFSNHININDLEILFSNNYNDIVNKLNSEQSNLNINNINLHTLKIDKDNLEKNLDTLANLEEELQNSKDIKKDLDFLHNSILLAKQGLDEAYTEMKNSITPEFTKNLCEIISVISNNKYNNIIFNDEQGLIAETDNGNYVECERLSIGTIDQMYLSLRLAVLKEISNDNIPIIFDDTFVYYDNERLENILKFLNSHFNNYQILLFSCTDREISLFDKLNINYNLINLEGE